MGTPGLDAVKGVCGGGGQGGKLPELLSDWEDLDSEMRLRRFAEGTQPSLLLRRFLTNLQRSSTGVHHGSFSGFCNITKSFGLRALKEYTYINH